MAARGKAPEAVRENKERWLLTYADLITLLLAFFVIMYAISNTDIVKYLNLRGSLAEAFNVGVLKGESSQSIQSQGEISSEGMIPLVTTPQLRSAEAQVDAIENQEGRFDEAVQFVGQRHEGIAISLAGSAIFISGSADLTQTVTALLGELSDYLRGLPNDIRVEGHSDNIQPGSERFPTNWELSTARAVTVAKFFEKAGVPPYRLSAFGYADNRSVAPNDSEANRSKNRRAEIVILNPVVDIVTGRTF